MFQLKVVDFINSHLKYGDWINILSAPPYSIKISFDGNYTMLNYNQLDSDFSNPIVKECRGLILYHNDNKHNAEYVPVCIPFFKFFNYGESNADSIDWDTAKVQEKIDGSLIKVWHYEGKWHISTNGTIDAHKSSLVQNMKYKTFYDLFIDAAKNSGLDYDKLNEYCTYMFELVSPYNKVEIPYEETKIYHIGTRNNLNFNEVNIDIGIEKPKEYNLHSLNDCIDSCSKMPYTQEGYVVVDSQYKRNKVKSPAWVRVHHLHNNGVITDRRIIDIVKNNEQEEFLTYFPEYKNRFANINSAIDKFIFCNKVMLSMVDDYCSDARNFRSTKKELAEFIFDIKKNAEEPYRFYLNTALAFYASTYFLPENDMREDFIKNWLMSQNDKKILRLLIGDNK